MNLLDIVTRDPQPKPWEEVSKIPWDDPEFSARMLREHLTQAHNAASRRDAIIDAQVGWIHDVVLEGEPSNILDLGCGPGLYCARLARRGHRCTGIDFGPASIAHARQTAASEGLDCTFIQGDLRSTPFGEARDLIMLIFGEFNTFRREDALEFLTRSRVALTRHGRMIIEAHTLASLKKLGESRPSWSTRTSGLYADSPYICVDDACWHEMSQTAVERHYVIDAATADVSLYGTTTQGYTREEYEALLLEAGFREVEWREDWPNAAHADEFTTMLARP